MYLYLTHHLGVRDLGRLWLTKLRTQFSNSNSFLHELSNPTKDITAPILRFFFKEKQVPES
jgi:hypothetical protein